MYQSEIGNTLKVSNYHLHHFARRRAETIWDEDYSSQLATYLDTGINHDT